ncbi:MAG: GWxTD domain-containing protein [Bacteroidetes bacterium]|nr:MAG: GWxTD domain-containing protein [Bacteroidota bacterium]
MRGIGLVLLMLGVFVSTNTAWGQRKKTLKAYLDHKNFYHPKLGNFVEIHLQFAGYTLEYDAVEGGLQSEVAVHYVVRNDSNNVVRSDAYRLQSPLMRDSIIEDFYEIRRLSLEPGKYQLELNLTDLHQEGAKPVTALQELLVTDFSGEPQISNVEVAEVIYPTSGEPGVFSKSGYEIIPRISNYYPTEAGKIPVYLEVYHPIQGSDTLGIYGLKQSIQSVKNRGAELEEFTRFTRVKVPGVLPILRALDIGELASGEYELRFELLDKDQQVLSTTSYYFDRFNERKAEAITTDEVVLSPEFQQSVTNDSLEYYVASLIPISKPAEIKNIIRLLKTKDKELYRKYLQSFWVNSTSTGGEAYTSWIKYKKQVLLVERLFGTNFMDGHSTDRGRVYLQYGSPNNIITRENSPSEYPYEIWRYDKIKNFSNKRFIFYNPDLVNNVYRLLHSDMVGEVQNFRWQQYLSKRNSTNGTIDDGNAGNHQHFGGNSGILYNQY